MSASGIKLGFVLKKPKKTPGTLAAAAATGGHGKSGSSSGAFASASAKSEGDAREFVTSFDPHAVALDAGGHAKRALVIPLLRANAWAAGGEDKAAKATGDRSADERAADALLADAAQRQAGGGGGSVGGDQTLVIPMANQPQAPPEQHPPPPLETPGDARAREVRTRLFSAEPRKDSGGGTPPTAPILRQNAVPGMDALADAGDKFRLDVSLRPDALDVHSDAYALVPIEDFGAALLRGMGWKGSADADADAAASAAPKPRHKLLGLGATARPPLPGDAKNKRGRPRSNRADEPKRHAESTSASRARESPSRARESPSRERRRERSVSRDGRRATRDGDQERASKSGATSGERHAASASRRRSRSSERRHSDDRRKRSRSRESSRRRRDDDDDDGRKRSSRR